MSDMVGNPEDRFSRVAAHYILNKTFIIAKSRYENTPMQYAEIFKLQLKLN